MWAFLGAKDHDLMQLSKVVGFQPTPNESDALQRISKFVRFAGRYPIARTPDEMRPRDIPAIGSGLMWFFFEAGFSDGSKRAEQDNKPDYR